jgi:ABC-type uncharacterized transport system auxiliary subunit
MRMLMYFLCLVVAFTLSAGCAAPQLMKKDLSPIKLQISGVVSNERPVAVCVEEFTLVKSISDPYIIGKATTGMFNITKPIRSEDPISRIVTNEIMKAFLQGGFTLENKEKSQYIVSGQIERFWVDEYATGWSLEYAKASVRYDFIIKNKDGKFVWANSIEGTHISGKSMDATKDDIPTLLMALKKSIESIFYDKSFLKAIAQ